MSTHFEVRIEALTIHAPSTREARGLADALPAALERALTAAARAGDAANARPAHTARIEGEVLQVPGGATGVADAVAQRVVDAVFAKRQRT